MPGYVLTHFFVYAIVNAFTPGPGNILALNTVTNYGWKKGKPLFFGIFTGYYVVQIICAVFVYGVGTFLPDALQVMKYIGAAYILWLAIHIAISKPEVSEEQGSASFIKGFLLQFVNVDTEFLHKALPDYQYHSGTDFTGMHMEHTAIAKFAICGGKDHADQMDRWL